MDLLLNFAAPTKFQPRAAVPHLRHFLLSWTAQGGRGGFPELQSTEVSLPTPILKVPTHVLGRCVLLVEDELLVAWDIERMLKTAGLRVLGPVSSVAAALALLKTEKPDAAILDLNLRGELATPVARRLRELGVPFVLSTAYNHLRADDEEAFSGVANLGKPLPSERCVQVLGEILAGLTRDLGAPSSG
jgi:two-component system, response regulator PdtaR